jgi:hypothetical protein
MATKRPQVARRSPKSTSSMARKHILKLNILDLFVRFSLPPLIVLGLCTAIGSTEGADENFPVSDVF